MIEMISMLNVIDNDDDRNEIGGIFERHGDSLLNFIRRSVHNEFDAQDILSETFFRVVRYYENFLGKDDNSIKGLLICFARSVMIDAWRKGKKVRILPFSALEKDECASSDGEDYRYSYEENIVSDCDLQIDLITSENIKIIVDEMNKLQPVSRDYCMLYYHYGFRIREIAGIYGSNESSVSTVVKRFKKRIREKLEKMR